jgi:hypothetical protein
MLNEERRDKSRLYGGIDKEIQELEKDWMDMMNPVLENICFLILLFSRKVLII